MCPCVLIRTDDISDGLHGQMPVSVGGSHCLMAMFAITKRYRKNCTLKVRRPRLSSARPSGPTARFPEILMPIRCLLATSLILSCLSAAPMRAAETVTSGASVSRTTTYKTVAVNGLNIFYREAGPSNAPAILMLHGFPSSSRMFDSLIPLLADRYHVVAPDYPGFGQSDAPAPGAFRYTFDRLAAMVDELTRQLALSRYVLFAQ